MNKTIHPSLSVLCLIIFLFLLCLFTPFHSFAVSIGDLTTDFDNFSALQPQADEILPIDTYRTDLHYGNISRLLAISVNDELKNKSDFLALKAIGLIASGAVESGRQTLSLADAEDKDTLYILLAKAMLLRLAQNYSAAEDTIKSAIIKDQNLSYSWNILGRIYLDEQKYPDAINSFQTALKNNTSFLPAYLNLGAAYFQTGQHQLALQTFNKAIELSPETAKAYLGKTFVLEATLNYSDAIKSLNKHISITGKTLENLTYLAELQHQKQNYNSLLTTAKDIEKFDTNRGLLYQARAHLYLNQTNKFESAISKITTESAQKVYLEALGKMIEGNFPLAKVRFDRALKLDTNLLPAKLACLTLPLAGENCVTLNQQNFINSQLGSYFSALKSVQKGKFSEALTYFNQAENVVPSFSTAGFTPEDLKNALGNEDIEDIGLGSFYYFINMPSRAENFFNKAVSKKPKALLGNYWLGQLSLTKGERDKAVDFFNNSIQQVSFFPSYYSLAELHLLRGDSKSAVNYYKKALTLKTDVGILIKLGLHYEKAGDIQSVEKIYTQLIEDFDGLYIGYNQLAWFYTRNNIKLNKAMELAKKANELQPGNAGILDTIGWINYKQDNIKTAQEYIQKALAVAPGNPSILYHLGAINYATGNNKVAREYLEKALNIGFSFDESEDAQNLLKKL